MNRNILTHAQLLYTKKNYRNVIQLLETHILSYKENDHFYLLLGISCLYCNDISGGAVYLKRALQLNPENIDILLANAAAELLQGYQVKSIEYWLKILDADPQNKRAERGLALLQDESISFKDISISALFGYTKNLFPHIRYPLRRSLTICALIAGGICVALVVGFFVLQYGYRFFQPDLLRQGSSEIRAALDIPQKINKAQNEIYLFNQREIQRLLNTIEKDFQLKRDNAVCKNINIILNSNASIEIKRQMDFVSSYLGTPTFVTLDVAHAYAVVKAEPWLYDSCYIKWSGVAVNITSVDDLLTFDFLVGYDERAVVEGIEKIHFALEYALVANQQYEIIGKIFSQESIQYIDTVAIRPIL